jgi:hypothetical protein
VLAGEASTPGSGSSIPGAGPLAPAREDVLASGIRLPETLPEPVETFAQRAPEMRAEVLEKMGGSAETERAVTLALEWFTRHQEPDGRWTGRHFDDRCGKCESHAEFDADAAMTGLTLLCYLGAGHTHVKDGAFQEHVRKALSYLVARQAPNGDLRQKETMYGQTVATVALCEAYAMTKDQALAGPARRAVEFVLTSAARSASPRSSPSEQDTPVLGWLVMTVESARRAGFDVPRGTFDGATRWLDTVSTRRNRGRYSYRPGEQPSTTMTAEAMFVQQILGHPRTETRMEQSASFIAQSLPAWEPGAPTHHWYYATLALFEHQGADWQTWNNALTTALLANQIQDGPAAGSWAPMDQWSRMGGRVYQTAICTLSLEVYYRYKPR